ncbi:MAG: hypothetical protein JSR82_08080 [Verrucomicrobia bacterium]|nr:hypothetical protein [Verrucomicrobiota bacterium]
MSWIDRLEKRLGWIAIPGLTKGIAVLTAIVWVLTRANPAYENQLVLLPAAVWAGEWWRLISFLFVPMVNDQFLFFEVAYSNGIWMLFAVLFLWFIGNSLEREWGAFRLTLYILLGYLGIVASALVLGAPGSFGPISLALFFAFATLAPNYEILVFFILPVRVKWLALISAVMLLLMFFTGGWLVKVWLLLCYVNYLVFFGPEWVSRLRHSRETAQRRNRFESARREMERDQPTMHACAVCGRTELSNPELEFRVSGLDEKEYCREHLPKPAQS